MWAIPLAVFVATLILGFALAPYYIHKDIEDKYKKEKITTENGNIKDFYSINEQARKERAVFKIYKIYESGQANF